MKSFKQYYLEESSRRGFLKSLFGGAAAMAVANPAQAATAVANAASAPWIKVTLEQDFTMYDYSQVSANEIAKLTAMKGDYTPGVSSDGGITIDYNDSAMDMMEVYVKPGTPIYKQMQARIDGAEQPEAGDAFDFEKQVFDTIGDNNGSGASWLEDQLESMASQDYKEFKNLPQDMKDERGDVDGIDDSGYYPETQMNASGRVKEFIDQAEEIGAEVPDHMRDIVGRGYMKSHVLANGSGNESISNDTMMELRELYDDEDIDYPDEMDSDRWLDGTADNPMDTMGEYDQDSYDRDMAQVQGTEDPDDDHAYADDWVTAGFNFLMGASQQQQQVKTSKLMNVPGYYQAIGKGEEMNRSMNSDVDMNKPLEIAYDAQGKEPIEIISGFEQLARADKSGELVYVKMINADELPTNDPKEVDPALEPEGTSHYMDNENI